MYRATLARRASTLRARSWLTFPITSPVMFLLYFKYREFKDVVFEDVVFDNNSYVKVL